MKCVISNGITYFKIGENLFIIFYRSVKTQTKKTSRKMKKYNNRIVEIGIIEPKD